MPPGRKIPRAADRRADATSADEGPAGDPELGKAGAELSSLVSRIRACDACGRASVKRAFGSGYPRAPVMLLKDRPSAHDLRLETAFASEAEALHRAFDRLGIPFSWVYGSTAVRCGEGVPATDDSRACSAHLLVEIEAVQPQVIVVFGPRALDGLRALQGRCGIDVPEDVPGGIVPIRPGLSLIVTESLPEGVTEAQAKRRLWRDLQELPKLFAT